MRRDPSCCWDYDGVSQCNTVWLAKTQVLVSGDTEILQRFRVLNKISYRKYDCIEASLEYILLFATAIPFIYYFLAIYSSSSGKTPILTSPFSTRQKRSTRSFISSASGPEMQAQQDPRAVSGRELKCPVIWVNLRSAVNYSSYF